MRNNNVKKSIAVLQNTNMTVFQNQILKYSGNPVFQGRWSHPNISCSFNYSTVHQPGRMDLMPTEAGILILSLKS